MHDLGRVEHDLALKAGLDPTGPKPDPAHARQIYAQCRSLAVWGRQGGLTTRMIVRALAHASLGRRVLIFAPSEASAVAIRRQVAALAVRPCLDARDVHVVVSATEALGMPRGTVVLYDHTWHEFAPLSERLAALHAEALMAEGRDGA